MIKCKSCTKLTNLDDMMDGYCYNCYGKIPPERLKVKKVSDSTFGIGITVIIVAAFALYLFGPNANSREEKRHQEIAEELKKEEAKATKAYLDAIERNQLAANMRVDIEEMCEINKYIVEKAEAQTTYPNASFKWTRIMQASCALAKQKRNQ